MDGISSSDGYRVRLLGPRARVGNFEFELREVPPDCHRMRFNAALGGEGVEVSKNPFRGDMVLQFAQGT